MTQEDKQLLLKDLCARLPYGVKVHITNEWFYDKIEPYDRRLDCDVIKSIKENRYTVKPYLRPLSSMTDEERGISEQIYKDGGFWAHFDWLNENHFDYRIDPSTGKTLITSNLALEAPEGMYKTS